MIFSDDHADFLDLDEFAEVVTIRNEPVSGIFNVAYVNPFEVGAMPRSAFQCSAASAVGIAAGEAVTREPGGARTNAEHFVVTDVVPDDGGMVLLTLRAA